MSIESLKNVGKTSVYPKGSIICREGDEGHSLYILLQGTVDVTINSFSNNAKTLLTLKQGSFFGEMSLLEKKPRSATVSTKTDNVIVLEISEKDFPALLAADTSIAYHLLLTLNKRLNHMLDEIEKENKRFVFNYRKNNHYLAIQGLNEKSFQQIAQESSEYVWTLLKYLSASLNEMNNMYMNYIPN